jgi:pyruvate-ferredoxin/flavodoxin oxidoreductase
VAAQRERVASLKGALQDADGAWSAEARDLLSVADDLVRQSVWIVGGDGWAYDIGAGGLDHVLASGRDVNVLVLDTEVYSNTGGQASKATPRGAIAKFAARGKATAKKDLGMQAMSYGNVFVAQIAIGGNEMQTVRAFTEAEAWPGPSLIIAYSTCIAHGIDMARSLSHQKDAVRSAYWPLYRFNPGAEGIPFQLDSKDPTMPLAEFAMQEARFAMLARAAPHDAERLMAESQEDVTERWHVYRQLAGLDRVAPHLPGAAEPSEDATGEES